MNRFRSILLSAAFPLLEAEVPEPLFQDSEAAFLDTFAQSQFDPQLDLHLVEYSAPASWAMDWAQRREAGNGLFLQAGSLTSGILFLDAEMALNVYPTASTQIRYDRRRYSDGRFILEEERFEALWYPGPRWALVLAGNPEGRKEATSLGLGFRLGAPRALNALDVRVMAERPLWNQKTAGTVRFPRQPVRLLADGAFQAGAWRLRGSLDYGLRYRAREEAPGMAPRTAEGAQRFLDLAAERRWPGWEAGARLSWNQRIQDQDGGAPGTLRSSRTWTRLLVYGSRRFPGWSGHGAAGWVRQDDAFSAPAAQDGAYRARTGILGLEAGRDLSSVLQMRAGILGSLSAMERRALPAPGAPAALPGRSERDGAAKIHLRAIFGWGPDRALECLLSHSLYDTRFGGASVKARFVF